ncbi:MAG: TonB-dependent receptor plug domain-containing protein [Bacteroidia bacterium]
MFIKRLLILLLLGSLSWSLSAQGKTRHTITGHIAKAQGGEVLINAKIFDAKTNKGVLTNNFGFFSLTLPAGEVRLVAAESGYESQEAVFNLQSDTTIEFKLKYYQVDEVEILADEVRTIQNQTEMSTTTIPVEQIKSMPALMGEVDVIKAVQMLPGVQSGTEGTSGLYVRGGGPDQNLILLDDVPLYYVSHLGGFFSVFNADALSSVKLTKGGFPARYGGRLSSVLDIRMKDGNKEKIEGEGSLGIIAGKLSLNGPIGKKTTFLASARRSWIDLLMRPLSAGAIASAGDGSSGSVGYQFYDLNGKITHTFSDKDRLYLSYYGGDDAFKGGFSLTEGSRAGGDYYKEKFDSGLRWGNRLAALRWNHIWNPKLFSNLTATYTNYRFRTDFGFRTEEQGGDTVAISDGRLKYQSGVRDFGLKLDFEYYPSPSHSFRFGAGITRHRFVPALLGFELNEGQTNTDTTFAEQTATTWEGALYAEDEIRLGSRFSANIGAHLAYYQEGSRQYLSPQLRLAARYQLTPHLSVKSSFVQMTQFLHLLTNSGIGLPIDLWVPATDKVPPQHSLQAAMGFAASLWKDKFELSVEGYYKKMDGLIEYKEGQSFFLSTGTSQDWQEQVEIEGTGEAYGVELLLQKKRGKTTGWLGYTLSWNNRQFENLNGGEQYPYRYDRRHDISLVVSHKLSKRVAFGANWVFGTGNALTLPNGGYGYVGSGNTWRDNPAWGNFSRLLGGARDQGVSLYENGRNGFRMQAYHRMDVSVAFTKQKKWGERTWTISFYNTYNRLNPFAYYYGSEGQPDGTRKEVIRKIALFPIIPSINYSFKF